MLAYPYLVHHISAPLGPFLFSALQAIFTFPFYLNMESNICSGSNFMWCLKQSLISVFKAGSLLFLLHFFNFWARRTEQGKEIEREESGCDLECGMAWK